MSEEITPTEAAVSTPTFDSIVKNEIKERVKKYRGECAALAAESKQMKADFNEWYKAAVASPEYARLKTASEKVLERINAAVEEDISEKLGELEQQFNAEWQKASDAFDELYARNPEKAVKRAVQAVDYIEYEYTRQTLKAAEMVVDFYIEMTEFELEYLRWMKKFCKNPERQLRNAAWYAESFMKKAERAYAEIQAELQKSSYSQDSDEAEFAQALRAFLDKFVG